MRGRYCVELDLDHLLYTVHRQSCMRFPLAELIPHNLVVDLGVHRNGKAAAREAKKRFVLPWEAGDCACLAPRNEELRPRPNLATAPMPREHAIRWDHESLY